MSNKDDLPVRKTMCATCPFKPSSPVAFLKDDLELSALTEASRICHSTGRNNAVHKSTGLPEHICRGARQKQLDFFRGLGIIAAPTDKAWNDARVKFGMKPQVIKNPGPGKFVKWEEA